MQVLDEFVYAFMHGIQQQNVPLEIENQPKRPATPLCRLLQDGANVEPGTTLGTSLGGSRDSAIYQLRENVPFFDVSSFGEIFDDIAIRNANLENEITNIRLETFSNTFDLSNSSSCMLSFGTVQNDIIMNFAKVLSKTGGL